MCIRDSTEVVISGGVLESVNGPALRLEGHMNGGVNDASAVSYTHLDVYKRQTVGGEGGLVIDESKLANKTALETAINEAKALQPVSYTHLDVYKRQNRKRGFFYV